MEIVLTDGEKRAEIEGDDDLIAEDLGYRYSFERRVTMVTDQYSATIPVKEPEA